MDLAALILTQFPGASGKTADALFERIRALILDGSIPAGTVFPKEPLFCEQLGISRSTLREAYTALESMGFIRRVKRLGTIVNDARMISRTAPLSTSLILSDLEELLEFRVMIEAELARLAARRACSQNIEVMHRSLEGMRTCGEDIPELTRYDTMFHMELARASGNHLLTATMENAREAFNRGISQAFRLDTRENAAEALLYHERILEAVGRHEPEEACAWMRQHIRSVGERIRKAKAEDGE